MTHDIAHFIFNNTYFVKKVWNRALYDNYIQSTTHPQTHDSAVWSNHVSSALFPKMVIKRSQHQLLCQTSLKCCLHPHKNIRNVRCSGPQTRFKRCLDPPPLCTGGRAGRSGGTLSLSQTKWRVSSSGQDGDGQLTCLSSCYVQFPPSSPKQ